MALSDQLNSLAARTKTAEANVAAARTKAKAQLEADVKNAQESATKHADGLRTKAAEGKDSISTGWQNVQQSFHEKVASAKLKNEVRKAEREVSKAQKDADNAERDAAFAIDFAYAAIEEAEYEVLDAILARAYADELAATGPVSAKS